MATSREMTAGRALPLIFNFTMPLLMGNLLQQTYSLVDAAIVGKFLGINALASVGASTSVVFLILGFCNGCCGGFGIPVAQKFGARDYSTMRRYISVSLQLAAVMSVVIAVVTSILCGDILLMMRTPDIIFQDAYYYLLITFIGVPCTFFYNLLSSIIRALGDSKTPFWFLLFSAVLNILLDLFCILVLDWGVAGAAIATVFSQGVSAVLCYGYMMRRFDILRGTPDERKFNGALARRLMYIGVPMGLQFSITAIGSIMLQSANNALGTACVAAFTAAMRIKMFFMCPLESLGIAMATYTGQNYGAKDEGRCKKIFRLGMLCSVISCGILSTIFVVFRTFFIGLFTSDPSVYHYAQLRFLIVLTFECLTSSYEISGGCLRGFGRSMTPAILTVFGSCVLRLIWLATVCNWFHDYKLLMAIYPISWVLTGTMVLVAYFRTRKKLFL